MKITDIEIGTIEIPLVKPFKTALRSVETLESIMLRIQTDEGFVGYGETAPTEAITGDSKETIITALFSLKSILIGRNIDNKENIIFLVCNSMEKNFNAKSAIEIALYDIWAQKAGMPLYRYLGGAKNRFKTGTTISLNPIDEMINDTQEAIDNGFDTLKIKLGGSYIEDIDRITSIWHISRGRASLKLDANQGWNREETVDFLREIQNRGISVELIEQPVPKDDLIWLKYISERTDIPILADESVFSPEDAKTILEMGAVDLVNIKLNKCGGITKALEIADICHGYGVKCMIGCMLEGAVSVGAASHVASARSETITMYDLDAPVLCRSSPVNGGAIFRGSSIILSEKEGLGIESVENIVWI